MNELDEIRAKFETLNPIPEGLIYYPKGDYYAIESDEDEWWSEQGQSIISAYQGRYCGFKMGVAQAPVVSEWVTGELNDITQAQLAILDASIGREIALRLADEFVTLSANEELLMNELLSWAMLKESKS